MSTIARFSIADYDRIVDSGALDKRRLELIRGEVREMAPIGSLHEMAVERLHYWSVRNLPEGAAWVRVQDSIGLPGVVSAPQPDLVWAAWRDYGGGRPLASDLLLIVEVSESSIEYDRGEKAALYAEAGIADYWIINLPDRCVEVCRQPKGSRYRSTEVYRGDDEVRPLSAPAIVFRPSILWGPNPIGPPSSQ